MQRLAGRETRAARDVNANHLARFVAGYDRPHAVAAAPSSGWRLAARRDLRQGRIAEPRRIGEGSRGAAHDPRRRAVGTARPGGKTLLDATSGNTGIAYAMIGAARGYRVKLFLPGERQPRAESHPARLRCRTGAHRPAAKAPTARFGRCAAAGRGPGPVLLRRPVHNPANWQAHYHTTGVEIWSRPTADGHPLRRGPRHERHVHGHGPPLSAEPTATSADPAQPDRRSTGSRG